MNKLTNLERLKLELHKKYLSDEEYQILLSENGLTFSDTYDKQRDELYLLQTVKATLQILSNNIDLYMKIQTEFLTSSSAFENLQKRIDSLNQRIMQIPSYEPQNSVISYLFHN